MPVPGRRPPQGARVPGDVACRGRSKPGPFWPLPLSSSAPSATGRPSGPSEGAFTSWDGVSAPKWIGLKNFYQLLHDSVFLGSFLHLLWWSLIGIPVGMGASLLVALLIYRLDSKRAQYWFRVAFALTLCLPGIVGILTWENFYEIGGVIDTLLSDVGLGRFDTAWLANPHTALGALIFMGFPWVGAFAMLVFYAGLQSIPGEIIDAASVDGISSLRRVWHVELPLIKGQLKVILILSIIGITQNLLPPLLLTGGEPPTPLGCPCSTCTKMPSSTRKWVTPCRSPSYCSWSH